MICIPRDEKNLADVERLVQREIPRLENPLGGEAPASKPEAETKPADHADKPKRSRSRSRKSDDKPESKKPKVEETPKTEPAVEAKPAPAEKPAQQHDDKRRDNNRNDSKGKDNNRSRNNDNRSGNKVVGLGDHLPDFIGLSFEERDN